MWFSLFVCILFVVFVNKNFQTKCVCHDFIYTNHDPWWSFCLADNKYWILFSSFFLLFCLIFQMGKIVFFCLFREKRKITKYEKWMRETGNFFPLRKQRRKDQRSVIHVSCFVPNFQQIYNATMLRYSDDTYFLFRKSKNPIKNLYFEIIKSNNDDFQRNLISN